MAQMTKPETLQGGAAKIDYEHMSVPDVKSTLNPHTQRGLPW